jgi:hypothetical protein
MVGLRAKSKTCELTLAGAEFSVPRPLYQPERAQTGYVGKPNNRGGGNQSNYGGDEIAEAFE